MINVVVASSVFIFREGMKSLLLRHKGVQLLSEVTCVEDAFACKCDDPNNVVVAVAPLKFRESKNLTDLSAETKRRLIVITIGKTIADIQAAIEMGARGILTQSCTEENILSAIRMVAAGRLYVAQEISALIACSIKSFNALSPLVRLTCREMEILKRVAIGRKMSTIGEELGISYKTVSAHKANILEKLALGSDSELVLYAMKHNLFDLLIDHSNRKQSRL
jgi:two-component system invasion response regulator UvrY